MEEPTPINIGLEGGYAEFAGSVLPSHVDVVLSTEPGQELEGKNRLARIGLDRVIGYLAEPYQAMVAHEDDVQLASRLTAKSFDERAARVPDLQVVDVRNPGVVAAGTIPHATPAPVVTGRRSQRACCDSTVSPTSATSWAVSVPRTKRARTPERPSRRPHIMTTATAKHQILTVGGGNAGITVAARMLRKGYTDGAVIEPSSTYYYQPLWTLVGGGQAKASTTERDVARRVRLRLPSETVLASAGFDQTAPRRWCSRCRFGKAMFAGEVGFQRIALRPCRVRRILPSRMPVRCRRS